MTFARSKSKEGPDRLRRRLLAAGAAAALCPAHALAGDREDLQQDWDVIVIGTGMAGLTAAVSAREAGCFLKRGRSWAGTRSMRRAPSPC